MFQNLLVSSILVYGNKSTSILLVPFLAHWEYSGVMRSKTAPKMGRPPAGTAADGKPEKTSEYPKLTISIRPTTKAKLDAVAYLEKKPAWRIVDAGIRLYVERMPPEGRRRVDEIARWPSGESIPKKVRAL
jgi:predicted NAD/FAD-binding protein